MNLLSNLSSSVRPENEVRQRPGKSAWVSMHKVKILRKGIWLYFFLLMFEGALRKWVLPGLSAPLLIVRDPIAIWLLYEALKSGVFKPNVFVVVMWILSVVAFIMALLLGHGSLPVAVYGLRITLIHFPLIFLFGKVLDRKEVVHLGQWLLWISLGMTILLAVQFYSPQTAWVNRGVGGDLEGSGFSGAVGYYRVPGTFSFTTGLSNFYGLVGAYILYFWLNRSQKEVPRWLLAAATVCLLAAIPLSISRGLLFQIGLSFAFVLVAAALEPKFLGRLVITVAASGTILLALLNFDFFQTAIYAFSERFTSASKVEGGLSGTFLNRFLGGMADAITETDVPFWGKGLGLGTNVGAQLLIGKRNFLIAEAEWGRLIGEMGLMLGLIAIMLRSLLVLLFFRRSWQAVKKNDFLAWLLSSFAGNIVLQGQWAQPTALGFAVLSGGLVLASLKMPASSRKRVFRPKHLVEK